MPRGPVEKVVGCVVVGCECVCVASSTGSGSQKGAAVRYAEAECLLGAGIG